LLELYWSVCPNLRKALFKSNRPGYLDLAVAKDAIKTTIYSHSEFASFISGMNDHFAVWRTSATATLKDLTPGFHPKEIAAAHSEDLLAHYANKPLTSATERRAVSSTGR
jgi:type I restriction enzyme M protein